MLLRQGPSGPTNKLPSFPGEPTNVNVGAVAVIDWSRGPAQKLTVSAICTVSSAGLPVGQPTWLQLKVVQGGAGSFPPVINALTPSGAPLTFSNPPGSVDMVSLYWDGAVLFATSGGLAYA